MLRFGSVVVLVVCVLWESQAAVAQALFATGLYNPAPTPVGPIGPLLAGQYVDLPQTEATVTVPNGIAFITWTTTNLTTGQQLAVRPIIENLAPPGYPALQNGSWVTAVNSGTVTVKLQGAKPPWFDGDVFIGYGFANGETLVSWSLIVFPDTPSHGLSCWDLNENDAADPPTEDVNGDGLVDLLDCRGADGADGQDGIGGLSCWDLDGDAHSDPDEDANRDGQFSALDCQGPPGPAVHTSAVCYSGKASCADTCRGADRVVAQVEAPCMVTSDTGQCSWRWQRSPGRCCVCAP